MFGETGRDDRHMAITWDDNAAQGVTSLSIPAQMLQSVRRGGLEAFASRQSATIAA